MKIRQQKKFEKLFRKKKATEKISSDDFSDIQKRWVQNKSSKVLDKATTSLLSKGLNFAIAPQHIPTEEIITSTELACKKLDPETAASLRSEVARSVKRKKKVRPNISLEELKALQELKRDQELSILPADKGRCTVVLDRSEYENKIQKLLEDKKTYELLKKDPTTTVKNKLLNIMKKWKKEGTLSQELYKQIYPTSDLAPKFYGLPKIHKPLMPLRPIVAGNGSVTENVAKHLAKILNAVKGKNPHSIRNSVDFVNKVKDLQVPPSQKMVSFDVSALFTSIPVELALKAIENKLSKDNSWKEITELSLQKVLTLLELCLSTTYFVFKGQFYRQKFGAPMGSPISPGVADLCMEEFEEDMLANCPDHLAPHVWYRFVDDTFTTLHEYSIEDFTTFLNSRNEHIQFTREVEEEDTLPFLDVCVKLLDDGCVKTTVFRKATHTDQYLNWESNHHLDHKRSVVRTLLNRAETHVSDPEDQDQERSHVKKVLAANGYRAWAFKIPNQKNKEERQKQKEMNTPQVRPPLVGLPYIQGLSEELQRIFKAHGVNSFLKPTNTLRQILVKPKDPTPKEQKCGVVYNVECGDCQNSYVGETSRKMKTRFDEHCKSDNQSAILEHLKETGHSLSLENVNILVNEPKLPSRKIREALEIYKRRPSLNRDQGQEIPPVLLGLLGRVEDTGATGDHSGVSGTRNRANSL